jgi:hypothetical protein
MISIIFHFMNAATLRANFVCNGGRGVIAEV